MSKIINFEFNGKNNEIELDDSIKDEMLEKVENCLLLMNNIELFDYLYMSSKEMFEYINDDPYFNGKTIKSGEDLKNSIEEIKLIAYKDNTYYICGEYWCDDEHGFSISFPDGNFIKENSSNSTFLGNFDDYL